MKKEKENDEQLQISNSDDFFSPNNLIAFPYDHKISHRPRRKPRDIIKSIKQTNIPDDTIVETNLDNKQQQKQQICLQHYKQTFLETTLVIAKSQCLSRIELINLIVLLSAIITGSASLNPDKIVLYTEKIEIVCYCIIVMVLGFKFRDFNNYTLRYFLFFCLFVIVGLCSSFIQDQEAKRVLKALRVLNLLHFFKNIDILGEPVRNLEEALKKILNILIPAIFIIYIYAIIGLYSFSGYQYNKCRDPINLQKQSDWTVYQQQVYLCGQRSCPIVDNIQYQCLNPIDYGVKQNPQELINITQGNGLLHFSNIFFSLLSTFKQTFITGSSRLIILYKQAVNRIYVELYFFSYIYLVSYIYMNIFIGLILMASWETTEKNQDIIPIQPQKKPSESQPKIIQSRKTLTSKKKLPSIHPNQLKSENSRKIAQMLQQSSPYELSISPPLQSYTGNETSKKMKTKSGNKIIFQQISSSSIPDCISRIEINQNRKKKEDSIKLNKNYVQPNKNVLNLQNNDVSQYSNYSLGFSNHIVDNNASQTNSQEQPKDVANIDPQQRYKKLIKTKNFQAYTIIHHVLILLCCINLSFDYRGQSQRSQYIVDAIDLFFYILFTLDVVIKALVQLVVRKKIGKQSYLHGFIWVLCTIGLVYEASIAQNFQGFVRSKQVSAKIFRSLKYFRFLVLLFETPYFQETKKIFKAIIRAVISTRNIIFLWTFMILILAIMGYELHHGKTLINSQGKIDLQNGQPFEISYEGIYNSLIFTLLTVYNEQWDFIMFQQYLGSGAMIIISQIFTLMIGLVLVSKYFMAMLVKELQGIVTQEQSIDQNVVDQEYMNQQEQSSITTYKNSPQLRTTNTIEQNLNKIAQQPKRIKFKKNKNVTIQTSFSKKNGKNRTEKLIESMCLKKLMQILRKILESKVFMWIRVVIYSLNFVSLINTHPRIDRSSDQAMPYLILENSCRIFFMIELCVNLLLYGLIRNQESYLQRSYINIVNLALTILQMLSFTYLGKNYIFIKIERLRGLRIFNLIQMRYRVDWNMRITLKAMIRLLPKIFSLLLLSAILYYYFALILVKMYKDEFYYCINYPQEIHIQTKWDCLNWGGDWITQSVNNSNIFNSLMFLFLTATTEGWISLMIPAMNLNGPDNQPSRGANQHIKIFFVIFFFIGNLLILNSFIGLSIWNFKKLKEKATGQERLKPNDRLWLRLKSQIYRLQPLTRIGEPKIIIRKFFFRMVSSRFYFYAKVIIFVGYLIFCSCYTYDPSEQHFKLGQNCFIFILVIDYFLELFSYGFQSDRAKKWIFQSFCTIYYIGFFIARQLLDLQRENQSIFGGLLMALQFFRFLQLIDEIPFANKLLNSLFTIFPRTSNIFLINMVILLIYAIFGMELFSYLRPRTQLDSFNQNYKNFHSALFALIKFSTMESPIQQIMDASSEMSPDWVCFDINSYEQFQKYGQYGCGSLGWAIYFFISFHVVYSLILQSTFVTLIVDAYSEVRQEQNSHITRFVLEKVRQLWSKSDPDAKGFIPYRQFWMFTAQLLQIYDGKIDKADIAKLLKQKKQFLGSLNLTIYENQEGVLCFQFHQVIQAITKAYLQKSLRCLIKQKNTRKLFNERISNLGVEFKKTTYNSSHVSTLIILKSGLKIWKRKANKNGLVVELNQMIKKFGVEISGA